MQSQAVCILGMHRSGTSAITRALNYLGIYIGEEEDMWPPGEDNPAGFWEYKDIVDLSESILRSMNYSWDAGVPLPDHWIENPDLKQFEPELDKIINGFSSKAYWGWKDPRTCLLFPLWNKVLERRDIEIKVVLPIRNPIDIARSLKKRDGIPLDAALGVWYNYTLSALVGSKEKQRIIVQYDQLIENYDEELIKIIGGLKLRGLTDVHSVSNQLSKFIDPSLRHSASTLQDFQKLPNATREMVSLYEMCIEASRDASLLDDPVFQARIESMYDELGKLNRIFGFELELKQTQLQLKQTQQELVNYKNALTNKESELWNAGQQLLDQHNKQNELNEQLSFISKGKEELEELVRQQKRRIADYESENADLRKSYETIISELEEQSKQINDQAKHMNYMQDEVNKRDHIINGIYGSRSWKVIQKLRTLRNRVGLKSAISSLRASYEISKRPEWQPKKQKWESRQRYSLFFQQIYWSLKSKIIRVKPTLYDAKIKQPIIAAKRPKVVHAIPNMWVGGSTQLIVDLVEYLGHKYDMEIITSSLPNTGVHKGLTIHQVSTSKGYEPIYKILQEVKADMVHVHYWGEIDTPWYNNVFEAVKKHNCMLVENINTPIAAKVDSIVSHYVYVSQYAQMMTGAWPENSSVIYPGSDFSHFKVEPNSNMPDAVGMVYRLEPDKLREDAIEAFIELVKIRPKTLVYIVGFGTFFHSYLEQVYAAGVRANFIFTGYVPYKKLPEIYNRFSIFVAPVWKESFGQVTPFAMSMEKGVAGYNIGALPEILGGDERLATHKEELALKIATLLDNRKELKEQGEINRRRATSLFSVQNMVDGYENLYDKLFQTSGPRS